MKTFDKIKYFVYCLDLLSQEFFFCFCSLFGIRYEGVGSSSIYVIYSVVLFALTMLFVVNDLIKNKRYIKKKGFIILPFVMSFIFLIESMITPETGMEWTWKSYMFFMLFCMPAMYVGTAISVKRAIKTLYPFLDTVIIIMTFGLLRSIPTLLSTGVASLTGGESTNYNTIAYCSAVCFGFIYYGLLSNPEERFAIFRSNLFRIISVVLLPALAYCAFSSGGRGGSLLLIVLFVYLTWACVGKENFMKVALIGVPLLIALIVGSTYVLKSNAILSAAFDTGTERAFQYITGTGSIDMTQTSNRDIIYENALNAVKEDPIAIRGLFRTIGMRGYPHNFFIEVLLDGGIFYLLFWVVYLAKTILKGYRMIKRERELFFMSIIGVYIFINTFFGGTYLMTGLFWFLLAIVSNYQLTRQYTRRQLYDIKQ